MKISMIAAIGKNRELGKDNKLLWHISEDFQRFKKITDGHVVIMGRKTYESLPVKFRPLPNRTNIVVTKNRAWSPSGCLACHSIEEAIEKSKLKDKRSKQYKEVFIIGGAEVYKQGIKYADKLYLTLVDRAYPEADAYFPDYSDFKKVIRKEKKSDGKLSYTFIELAK